MFALRSAAVRLPLMPPSIPPFGLGKTRPSVRPGLLTGLMGFFAKGAWRDRDETGIGIGGIEVDPYR